MKNKQVVLILSIVGIFMLFMSGVCAEIDNFRATICFGGVAILSLLFLNLIILTTKPNEEFGLVRKTQNVSGGKE